MPFETMRWLVSRRPLAVVAFWAALALIVGLAAPSLTQLAAEGQAHLLPDDAESARAAELIRTLWPDQAYASLAVVVLHREGGLTDADRTFAQRLEERLRPDDSAPPDLLRLLGPSAPPEVAERLVSRDRTTQLLLAHIGTSFVSPKSEVSLRWLQRRAAALEPPSGLQVLWTGDAVFGRDYMQKVQTTLDRAALATVFLLLIVLLAVYRSFLLAMIPLLTIGVGVIIARGVLAWLTEAGWETSPLVELFLIVILFGCGTDFCLFLSWRFGEHWNPANPAGAMRATLRRAITAILTSAGTVIVGLCLMGTTRFKLFSSTGPSVALGLALTVAACLTLTPALLVLLARSRPRSFAGLTAPASGFWDWVGRRVLDRPILTWLIVVGVMLPVAYFSHRYDFLQDLLAELPAGTPSVQHLRLVAQKFGPGAVAPLTVVLEAQQDLKASPGLALIDDVSRLIAHQRDIEEVRSATQPLGSPAPLEQARLAARLAAVNHGFDQMIDGASRLQESLNAGAAKLRTAIALENLTGLPLTRSAPPEPAPSTDSATRDPVVTGLLHASSALLGLPMPASKPEEPAAKAPEAAPPAGSQVTDPRETMLRELVRAANGAGQIADGARRARQEVTAILNDPVGRRALDRLLITPRNIKEHPELLRAFAAYISPDGRHARIDITQEARIFSGAALDQVGRIRQRLREYLDEIDLEEDGLAAHALVAGANAYSYDIRELTRHDQFQSWIIVPAGVFLVLVLALRDPWACVNLVATMVLTYAFALGATYLLFVSLLGAEGIDWKVPYFLFVLLVAVGVDYNVFLMTRLHEETRALGLRAGIARAVAQTGGLISSAAVITAASFASFLFSPLGSIRQLGFALVVGIVTDAVLVRPLLVPIGQWVLNRRSEYRREMPPVTAARGTLVRVSD
ncbi:MAG: MMPL family transporter [Isosphaeraceae bacterium]|nr:MMPL family transporter [Isosphaeraceae bacterium]